MATRNTIKSDDGTVRVSVTANTEDDQPKPTEAPQPSAPKAPPADLDTTPEIGHERALTSAELAEREASSNEQAAPIREPKEAHKDAAVRSMVGFTGQEFNARDLRAPGMYENTAEELTSVRLLFDWRDGQGVLHELGKELDLPWNEAKRLVNEGRAERVNPPEVELAEDWIAQARLAKDAARGVKR